MSKPPYWVSRVPVLSTAHVQLETMERLQCGRVENAFGTVAAYPEGVFLSLTTVDIPEDLSPDLAALCRWVRQRRYGWIRLDADCDVVSGLPTYDW